MTTNEWIALASFVLSVIVIAIGVILGGQRSLRNTIGTMISSVLQYHTSEEMAEMRVIHLEQTEMAKDMKEGFNRSEDWHKYFRNQLDITNGKIDRHSERISLLEAKINKL